MKAIVNDKKHITLVSHTNGVTIVEASGCIIVDFNVSAMDIYYIHKASPNVVRKFNYDNFSITCKDQRTANTINTLLNCSNISVYDIMDKFKDDITYSNTH